MNAHYLKIEIGLIALKQHRKSVNKRLQQGYVTGTNPG